MLKTKLAYMALGALIASIGYFIGTFNNLNAQDEVARVKKLIVSEEIILGETEFIRTLIKPGEIILNLTTPFPEPTTFLTTIVPGEMNFANMSTEMVKNVSPKDLISNIRALPISYLTLSMLNMTPSMLNRTPLIEMHETNGKKITLSIDKQAEIKLSNGGLKSKTVAVD